MNMIYFQTKDDAFFTLASEQEADKPHREHLLDLTLGKGRKRKSSEVLRRGRLAACGLSFVVKNTLGELVGSVRLWHVQFNKGHNEIQHALLLGPLAVAAECSGIGIGSALMRHAIATAKKMGYGAIFLVGDCAFYQRFGFSSSLTKNLAMPGPYEKHRFQALELIPHHLTSCHGILTPSGELEDWNSFQHHKVA
ncbi:N-acetyltransferase [Bartonella henselae]|uniref:GNAT family N-acetyltransferase n=1 Tax=Bartonella henselae TaxID=38323 RepID=UPI0009601D1F|nr:N-acetyltransferase [Bartonella henselae]OLL53629.1 acetyltransferase [Bartonella henselae]OLL53740.1 acetyltransferase [Bartonella henselae]OLL55460.1 acetyltransferase [Bartonella henselae]UJM33466.1 N-acetyltransferase [Bartonella henselae]